MLLQDRDRAVLRSLYKHRYLTSDHIRLLHFPGRTTSPAQVRLRKLWSNHFLDRYFLPIVLDGVTPKSLRPLYTLATKGAKIVAEEIGLALDAIPHTLEQNARGFATLEHHLVVTDLLVALVAACAGRDDIELVQTQREATLRSAVADGRPLRDLRAPFVVSDGAFALSYPHLDAHLTFHVEVVRADVRGGNKSIVAKLAKCASLHRQGFFQRAFGHDRVRAVLVTTTSPERSENLRRLAAQNLRHGRRLFWFGAYPKDLSANMPPTTFTPDMVLDPMWTDTEGETYSLIQPDAPRP